MNIHEYQAKELLKNFGVPVAKGEVLYSKENVIEAAKKVSDSL